MIHQSTSQSVSFPVAAMLQIERGPSAAGALSALDRLVGRRLNLIGFCAILKGLPAAGPALIRSLAPGIASFLSHDCLAVITEEDEGLLPYLNRRLMVGDNLDDVIRQLTDEHRQDREQARLLAAQCLDFASGAEADWLELCELLAQFAERQRRHLVWEDATILPVARERLSADDLRRWGAEMDRRYQLLTCSPL